jgi:hypothetical protein
MKTIRESIHIAVRKGLDETVSRLLEKGVHIEEKDQVDTRYVSGFVSFKISTLILLLI